MDSIQDVVAARAEGPALPADARDPMPATAMQGGAVKTTAERLQELNDLKARGLIDEAEYTSKRRTIIQGQ